MVITYCYHSGFLIEGERFKMVIDYYAKGRYDLTPKLAGDGRRLYVLSSHAHGDHYDTAILNWGKFGSDTRYLLSSDIQNCLRPKPEGAAYIAPGEIYCDDDVWVKAYGSTDEGVSFVIRGDCGANEKILFHAGDLNNWHWREESTPEAAQAAEAAYLAELARIAAETPRVDCAMFPVDPRLGAGYMDGARQFVSRVKTGLFLPMHFGAEYDKANAFRGEAEAAGCAFGAIRGVGDVFQL